MNILHYIDMKEIICFRCSILGDNESSLFCLSFTPSLEKVLCDIKPWTWGISKSILSDLGQRSTEKNSYIQIQTVLFVYFP